MTPVRLQPAASRSRVKHSTTEPLRSRLTGLSYPVIKVWQALIFHENGVLHYILNSHVMSLLILTPEYTINSFSPNCQHQITQTNTPGRRQSKTLLSIDKCWSKIARNSASDCHLSPVGWQMAIENSISNDFLSTLVDSINILDNRLPGVVKAWSNCS